MTWHCFEGYTLKAKRWHLATFGFPFITKIDYIYSLKPVAQVGVDVEPCCRCDRPGRECEDMRTDEGRTRSIIKCTVSKNVLLHNNMYYCSGIRLLTKLHEILSKAKMFK